MHILVVEDEVRLAETLKEILKTQKYTCDLVYDGEDGLAYAESGIYDVILLDIMLPKLDGFDGRAAGCAPKRPSARRCILLSAQRDEVSDKVGGAGLRRGRLPGQAVFHRGAAGAHPRGFPPAGRGAASTTHCSLPT